MIDWAAIFIPQNSIPEVVLRGTIIYLLLFLVLRFFMNRQAGAVGIPDILVVVLIVEASQNAMGKNESVTEAAILVATVMAWSFLLQWLAWRFPALEFVISSPKVKLIENGKLIRRNMRREMVTDEEVATLLRSQGIESPDKVKAAYIEGSGEISVICFDKSDDQGARSSSRDKLI